MSCWQGLQGTTLWATLVWAASSCSLDFSIAGREFECPISVTNCVACNPDGTCRVAAVVEPNQPVPPLAVPPPPDAAPALDGGLALDAGSLPVRPAPDASLPPPGPDVLEECSEFQARSSDSLCLNGNTACFVLGDVLSPALTAWLDPTTLPRDGARYWCDRSGKGHHAILPDAEHFRVELDDRKIPGDLARSLTLDGGGLSLDVGSEPALRPGNFAVVTAAATPLEAADHQQFDLFESGEQSRIRLSIGSEGGGVARGEISSLETSLVPDPVVTRSLVYDGGFHLYSLYRRSEVRVLDDVLQLRLNGVLEFRGSSIAIPRALDLSSNRPPRIGNAAAPQGSVTAGRGRIAAIVILRGSVPEDELTRLENFLCDALAVCTAPGPRLETDPPPVVEPDPPVPDPDPPPDPALPDPPLRADGGI